MFQTTNQASILYHGQHISRITKKNIVVTVCHTHHHEPWGFYLHCPIFDVSFISPYSLRRVTSFWGSGSIPVMSWLIILMNLDI